MSKIQTLPIPLGCTGRGKLLGVAVVTEFEMEPGREPRFDVNLFTVNQEEMARLIVVLNDHTQELLEEADVRSGEGGSGAGNPVG